MAAPQWMPASPALSAVSAASIGSNATAASIASTTGSFKYVPPAKRILRNTKRVDLDIARLDNDIVDEAHKAAKHLGPRLPYFQLPYCMNKEQLSYMVGNFPRTTFRCIEDRMHDHPIAHAETMIGRNKIERMVPQGHTVIDLFGDPGKADAFNRSQRNANLPKRMIPYCATKTEKDNIRALGWGSPLNLLGGLRYVRSRTGDVVMDVDPHRGGVDPCFGVVDTSLLTYTAFHTLYYLSDYQIASLLRPQGSRICALVHRHIGIQGSLFNGECTYGKKGDTVEQVNKLTGERYVHRDLSWLWDSGTKVVHTQAGSFVWTFHMVTAETWIVVLTGTPVLDERVTNRAKAVGGVNASHEVNDAALVPSSFPHPGLASLPGAVCHMVGGIPLVSFTNKMLPATRLTCPELYEYLRIAQLGKPRDAERLNDLFSLARSHVANGSEFPGKRNFRCSSDDLPGHVSLAFVSGLTKEHDLLLAMSSYKLLAKEHSALLSGYQVIVDVNNSLPTSGQSAMQLLKRVNEGRKRSDLLTGVISALE